MILMWTAWLILLSITIFAVQRLVDMIFFEDIELKDIFTIIILSLVAY